MRDAFALVGAVVVSFAAIDLLSQVIEWACDPPVSPVVIIVRREAPEPEATPDE